MNEIRLGMLENFRVCFYYSYSPEPPPPKKKLGGGDWKEFHVVKTNDILQTSH